MSHLPVYLVLGGYGGIGSAVTRLLEESRCHVAVGGRDADRLKKLDAETAAGRIEVDATSLEQVESAVRQVQSDQGRIDGIVNCVGSLLLKPAHLTRSEEWTATIDTNLGSAFAVVRAAGLVIDRPASVVLMSSAAANVGISNHEAIAAAKGGISALTRSAAATYASRGLRFNAVAPGLVRTPLTERITKNASAEQASTALHALGRLGEPGDVARLIVWLLDPSNDWITGQVLGADGGLSSVLPRGSAAAS